MFGVTRQISHTRGDVSKLLGYNVVQNNGEKKIATFWCNPVEIDGVTRSAPTALRAHELACDLAHQLRKLKETW